MSQLLALLLTVVSLFLHPRSAAAVSLTWSRTTNVTKPTSPDVGSLYNLLTIPVAINGNAATVMLHNQYNVSVSMLWNNVSLILEVAPGDSGEAAIETTTISTEHTFAIVDAHNASAIIAEGLVTGLCVDCIAWVTFGARGVAVYSIEKPQYSLWYRDRDNQATFFTTEPTTPIYFTDDASATVALDSPTFNLVFIFTIPIYSFNFYALNLTRFVASTGSRSDHPPSTPPPLLHIPPYYTTITPRFSTANVQAGDYLTVEGGFSIGPTDRYGCWFEVPGIAAFPSEPVLTNSTGMYECQFPSLSAVLMEQVSDGDELRVIPQYLQSWHNNSMYKVVQLASQTSVFRLSVPALAHPWWAFSDWKIYAIMGGGVLVLSMLICLTLRKVVRAAREKRARASMARRAYQAANSQQRVGGGGGVEDADLAFAIQSSLDNAPHTPRSSESQRSKSKRDAHQQPLLADQHYGLGSEFIV